MSNDIGVFLCGPGLVDVGAAHHRVCVSAAVIPRDIRVRRGVDGGLMRPHRALDEELKQVGAQHVPVVVVVLLAVFADHHQTPHTVRCQQCLIDREIGQILFDRHPFGGIERRARLEGIQRRRRVAGIVGERVRGQARRKIVAHVLHGSQQAVGRATFRRVLRRRRPETS